MVASDPPAHNFFRRLVLPENHGYPNVFFPRHGSRHVKSALHHVISLAKLACVHTWAWAAVPDKKRGLEIPPGLGKIEKLRSRRPAIRPDAGVAE
jgi:hypothetical protein